MIFLCSVMDTTSYENLLKLVVERGFILVLLGSYFSYQGIKFRYVENFPKISFIYCDDILHSVFQL